MKYYEVTIETSETGIELLTARLLAIGIENIAVSDPADVAEIMEHKQSYEWDYIEDSVAEQMHQPPVITVYSDTEEEAQSVVDVTERLREDFAAGALGEGLDPGTLHSTLTEHDDSEWKDKWKEYFKPFRASDHIVIRPSWEDVPDLQPEDILIEIDPGMAFGTGTHETTSMCIGMLEKYVRKGDRVLDAGCGSGILSIAAAKLGAGEVLGVDVDETAVQVAEENIAINGESDIARAEYGDVTQGIGFEADLVVANLMAELICMITPGIPAHLADGGIYITSGILLERQEMVLQALKASGFSVVEIAEKGEWCCIAARKGEV